MKTPIILTLLAMSLVSGPAIAQESPFAADVRREGERIAENCDELKPKAIGLCAYTLATDSPFHVAFGSLAPQNGFALGLAFNTHRTPNESWRLSWSADGVRSFGGSWRGGVYMKIVHTPETSGVILGAPGPAPSAGPILPRELTVIDVFAQAISLNTIGFNGLGQNSLETSRSVFGERQTIVGGSVTYPLSFAAINRLRPALTVGVNSRAFDIRTGESDDAPSVERLHDDRTAPGLSDQKAFIEFHEGIRLKPSLPNGRLRVNYLFSAQQFRTSSDTRSSFNRWTVDLQHEIPIYRGAPSTGPREFNGPNDCRSNPASPGCPAIRRSRDLYGSIGFRLLVNRSTTGDDNRVPFFLQPTLGGSDINGERLLASYQDYRFRGPNRFVLQESVEHAIWGPFGGFAMFEQGKVSGDGLAAGELAKSATVGVTLRAGGFPMVNLSFSWGAEGHHIIGAMNSSLLGGSARPSLY